MQQQGQPRAFIEHTVSTAKRDSGKARAKEGKREQASAVKQSLERERESIKRASEPEGEREIV